MQLVQYIFLRNLCYSKIWEHGDSLSDDSICPPAFSKQAVTPSSSHVTTPSLNSPMDAITLSSQDSTVFSLHQAVLYRESEAVVPPERVSFMEIYIWTERGVLF